MLEGAHESLWLATAPPAPRPPLHGDLDVDVAIVGAGIVGLTAAYLLQKEGLRVAVLERERILHGVSGKTTAKVTSQHGVVYHTLAQRFGDEKARLHGEANERAKETVARLVQEVGAEDAKLTRAPNYVYTTDESQVERFRKEAETAARLGLPASFTTETELPFPVKAAVRFENQAHFHPVRYLAKLAERAEAAGARIFERSLVIDLDDGETCKVKTSGGTVRAKHVLVATNVPALDKASFVMRMKPQRGYALAARAPNATLRGMYVNEDTPHRSVRPYESDEGPMLVFSGERHTVGERDHDDHYGELTRFARENFSITDVAYRWSTQDYFPVDELPLIGKYSPVSKRTFTATGFRAWGMTQGTLAAEMFADLVLGRENPMWDVYDPFAPARLAQDVASKEFLKLQAHVTKEFVGERLKREPAEAADLAPGEGRIVTKGLKKIAMARDADGTLRMLSATCTHMGCLVAWNPHEKSWDCPCHGSRFGTDGRVLHGPAVKALEPVKE